MNNWLYLHVFLTFAAALFTFALALHVRFRYKAPGAMSFMGHLLAAAGVSFTTGMVMVSGDPDMAHFWETFRWLFLAAVSPLLVLFVMALTGRDRYLNPVSLLLLFAIPVLTQIIAWTNASHGLMVVRGNNNFDTWGPFLISGERAFGIWFWVHVAYSYLLISAAAGMLIETLRSASRPYRQQYLWLLIGILFPVLMSIVDTILLLRQSWILLIPYGFAAMGLMFAGTLFRYRLFELRPVVHGQLIDTMNDALIVVDSLNRVVDLNPAARALVSLSPQANLGQSAAEYFKRWPVLARRFQEYPDIPGGKDLIQDEKGNWYDVEISILDRSRGPAGWLVMLHDVTEDRRLESALRASEELYRSVAEGANDGIALIQNEIIRYANPQLAVMLGYPLEEMIGVSWTRFILPEQVEEMRERHRLSLQGDLGAERYEAAAVHQTGQSIPVELNVGLLAYNGEPAILMIVRDIAERKEYEERLRASQLLLQSTFASLRDAVFIIDAKDRHINDCNPAATEVFGYRGGEMLGKTSTFLHVDEASQQAFREQVDRALQTIGYLSGFEYQMRRKSGATFASEHNVVPLEDEQGKVIGWVSVVRDITERKQAEAQIQAYARHQALLNETTQAAIETTDFKEMIQILADRLGDLFEADGCYITLWDEAQGRVYPGAAYGPLRYKYSLEDPPEPGEPTVTDHVLRTGKVIGIEDVFNTPYLSQRLAEHFPTRSMLGVPLIVGEQKLGAALISYVEHRTFTEDDITLCEQVARQVALAIMKARLFDAEREQRQLAETLLDVGVLLGESLDVNTVLDRMLELMARVVPYDSATVFTIVDGCARLLRARGYERYGEQVPEQLRDLELEIASTPYLRRIVETRQPWVVTDTAADPDWIKLELTTFIRSWVGAPIVAEGEVIAMFSLDNCDPNFYRAEHARRLSAFTGTAALAFRNAQLFEQIQLLAITDPLTGLYNRRHLFVLAEQEFRRAYRYGHPLSIAMLDIDHFKQVNDAYGHLVGDQVLAEIARNCQEGLRKIDVLSRYGGEEFIILLPETDLEQAREMSERLRRRIAETPIDTERGLVRITISVGIASLSLDTLFEDNALLSNLETLIDRADQALYQAKQSGRNRVVVYQG